MVGGVLVVFKRTRLMLEDIDLIVKEEIWRGHQALKLVKAKETTLEWDIPTRMGINVTR